MQSAPAYPWTSPNEILKQIREARALNTNGFIFYSATSFNKIKPGLADSLQQNYFGTIAIPPAMTWLDHTAPPAPVLKASHTANGIMLQWEGSNTGRAPMKYLVYRFAPNEKTDLSNAENIVALTKSTVFIDKEGSKNDKYIVTALDRLWNESEKSNTAELVNP